LYSPPGVNLKSLVNDLSGLLEAQLRTPWQSAKPGVNAPGYQSQSSRQAAGAGGISPANAQRRLADGGAYCELIPLIDGLTKNAQTSSKNQPQAGRTITAYQTIQTRLFNLRPAETIMTG
ncbi:MAG: hypothetical protein ACRD4Q_09175, partial [Candidatus Acidiferrales bacterium]